MTELRQIRGRITEVQMVEDGIPDSDGSVIIDVETSMGHVGSMRVLLEDINWDDPQHDGYDEDEEETEP